MIKTILATTVFLCGTTAQADGLYYGGGVSLVQGDSLEGVAGNNSSTDTYGAITGTVGYRWDQTDMFFGAELGADIAVGSDFENGGNTCSDGATGPYYCEHSATTRLRGIVGMPVGNFEGFASFGFAASSGSAATSPSTSADAVNSGYTVGLGLQQDFNGNTLRYELIYDNLETNTTSQGGGYEPTFEAVSLNVSYLFN
ncbi:MULTISPECIES: hypothetical protein [Rhodobacterales]|uniref:hypothetical protein n=1 Tax=Rhodobacterales TaxID=204455 RepID=UPI000DE94332|nr:MULTISPECIES: hypothetical protein [Rhodobacterales]MDO6591271.1 hypothetical protein [Yoonia sp. 1_MG-2023]